MPVLSVMAILFYYPCFTQLSTWHQYDWVLPIYLYKDRESLIASLNDEIIEPADKKARELAIEKAKRLEKP